MSEQKYVLRLFDMFDGWIDIKDNLTESEAQKLYDKKTVFGTVKTEYSSGDYYKIFPSGTKMVVTPESLGR